MKKFVLVGFIGLIISSSIHGCFDLNTAKQPPSPQKAVVARWIAHNAYFGSLSTISVHLKGSPFGNIVSFVDGTINNSTGNIYMKKSPLDTSMKDLKKDNRCSITISLEAIHHGYCSSNKLDAEDPRCTRMNIFGSMKKIENTEEKKFAEKALYERHPAMKKWNGPSHDFGYYKLEIEEVWLIDFFGGATILNKSQYFNVSICENSKNSKQDKNEHNDGKEKVKELKKAIKKEVETIKKEIKKVEKETKKEVEKIVHEAKHEAKHLKDDLKEKGKNVVENVEAHDSKNVKKEEKEVNNKILSQQLSSAGQTSSLSNLQTEASYSSSIWGYISIFGCVVIGMIVTLLVSKRLKSRSRQQRLGSDNGYSTFSLLQDHQEKI